MHGLEQEQIGLLVYPTLVFIISGLVWFAAIIFGPRRFNDRKSMPFEHGNQSFGTGGKRYVAGYFLSAVIFMLFSSALIFIYPWAVLLPRLNSYAVIAMLVFLSALGLALYYIWRKGATKWE